MAFVAFFFFGVLWIVGRDFGIWGVVGLVGGLMAAEFLIVHAIRSRRNFRTLEPLEKELRRASQGFALMVFVILALTVPYVWLHGWRNFLALFPWALNHPADAWPMFVCAGLFAVGLIRFRAGARKSAGARDDIRQPEAFVKLAVGLAIIGFLTMAYPWGQLGDGGGFLALVFAYAVGLWCALVGAMRFLLLTVGGGNALGLVNKHIQQTRVVMRPVRSRPWWMFWKFW